MKYLLLICVDEDAEDAGADEPDATPGRGGRVAGTGREAVEYTDLDGSAGLGDKHPAVRFGSVDVRPFRWRDAA